MNGQIALVSTIQCVTTLQAAATELKSCGYDVIVPQAKAPSPSEILGCTSPQLPETSKMIIYLSDGRFHLESAMIANPKSKAYKYDPYEKKFTIDEYDHQTMQQMRNEQVTIAKRVKNIGIILGTLGRQGSPNVLRFLEKRLYTKGFQTITILLSEIGETSYVALV